MPAHLRHKQLLFVKEYLVDFNGSQAAVRAGYSPRACRSTAVELLTNPNVQQAIQESIQERAKRIEVTQDWVINKLVENLNRAMTAVPVYGKDGEPTGEYTYQGNVANKALELLGRHLGMFQDAPMPPPGQQLQPGQTEVTWRVVYDTPPQIRALPMDALTNGHSDSAP